MLRSNARFDHRRKRRMLRLQISRQVGEERDLMVKQSKQDQISCEILSNMFDLKNSLATLKDHGSRVGKMASVQTCVSGEPFSVSFSQEKRCATANKYP